MQITDPPKYPTVILCCKNIGQWMPHNPTLRGTNPVRPFVTTPSHFSPLLVLPIDQRPGMLVGSENELHGIVVRESRKWRRFSSGTGFWGIKLHRVVVTVIRLTLPPGRGYRRLFHVVCTRIAIAQEESQGDLSPPPLSPRTTYGPRHRDGFLFLFSPELSGLVASRSRGEALTL